MTAPSYHDVVVYCDGQCYRLFDDSYALFLTCTRGGGWELWHSLRGGEEPVRMGGEYDERQFGVEVKGVLVCGTKPDTSNG